MNESNIIGVDVLSMRHENGSWSCVAVNMDIWGYGDTEEEAFNEMVGSVSAQVSFAVQQDDMSLLDFPAEDKYIHMYKQAKFEALSKAIQPDIDRSKEVESNLFAKLLPPKLMHFEDFCPA